MPKRRIDTRFLRNSVLILFVVMGLAGGLLYLGNRNSAKRYEEAGDREVQRGNLEKARDYFGRAVESDHGNAPVFFKLGNVYHALISRDPDLVGYDLQYWQKALEVDPRYLPAVQRMFQHFVEVTEMAPSVAGYDRLGDLAERLSKLEPQNTKAAAHRYIAVLGAWLEGKGVSDEAVDAAIAGLREVAARDADDGRYLSLISWVYLRRSEEARSANEERAAAALQKQARGVFETAIAQGRESAGLYFRYSLALSSMADPDRTGRVDAKAIPELTAVLDKARSLSKPTDAIYDDILIAHSRLLMQQERFDEAEKTLRDLADERPGDPQIRIALAGLLRNRPGKREEAIAILRQPLGASARPGVLGVMLTRPLKHRRLVELGSALIDQCVEATDATSRAETKQQIEDVRKEMVALSGPDDPASLKLQGRALLIDADSQAAIQAIKVLQKAQDNMGGRRGNDLELTFLLARAYLAAGQTGQAKVLLQQVTDRRPGFVAARKALAEMFIRENTMELAAIQVDRLERLAPGDPDVIRLRLQLLDPSKAEEQITKALAQLPEETKSQKLSKANVAMRVGALPRAEEILRGVLAQDTTEMAAVDMLTRTLLAQKKTQDARDLVEGRLRSEPDNRRLLVLKALVDRAGPADLDRLRRDLIEKETDPYTREMLWYAFHANQGDIDEAGKHLDAAAKIKPGETRTLSARFDFAISSRKFSIAEEVLPELSRRNTDQANGLILKIRLLRAKGEVAQALAAAGELTRQLPEFASSWLALAQAQQASGDFDLARANYNRALQKQSDNLEALRGLVQVAYATGMVDEAKSALLRAARAYPRDPWFGEQMLRHEERYGEPEKALVQREKNRDKAPDSLAAWTGLAECYRRSAERRLLRQDVPGATDLFAKARSAAEEMLKRWPDEQAVVVFASELAGRTGRGDEELEILQQFGQREAWRNKPEPFWMKANYYRRANQVASAEILMKRAVEVSGSDPRWVRELAEFYARVGETDKAVAVLDELAAKREDMEPAIRAAELMVSARKLAEAEARVRALLAKSPANVQLLNMAGFIALAGENYDKAMTSLNESIARSPRNPAALFYRGTIYLIRGQLDKAQADLTASRDIAPAAADARIALADVFRRIGDSDAAGRELESVLDLAPTREDVRLRLYQVYSEASPPRWVAAEKVLTDTQSIPELRMKPLWRQVEARMWLERSSPEKALVAIRSAMASEPTNALLKLDYFDALLKAGQNDTLVRESDGLDLAGLREQAWRVPAVRTVALWRLARQDAAKAEFERGMGLIDTVKADDAITAYGRRVWAEVPALTVAGWMEQAKSVSVGWRIAAAIARHEAKDHAGASAALEGVLGDPVKLSPRQLVVALNASGSVNVALARTDPKALSRSVASYQAMLSALDQQAPSAESAARRMIALNNLAGIVGEYLVPPDVAQSLVYAKKAHDIMRELGRLEPSILDTYGWALVQSGQRSQGIALLIDASSRDRIPDAMYHLGRAYLDEKRGEDAYKALRQALDLIRQAEKQSPSVMTEVLRERVTEALGQADLLRRTRPVTQPR